MFIEKKQFYDGDDIQHMLYFLKINNKIFAKFKKALEEYSAADISAILSVVSDCFVDDFDRYDSEVSEIFLREFEKCFLKSHGIPRFILVKSKGNDFTVLDLEDNSKETVTKDYLDNVVSLGIDVGGYNIK